MSGGCRREIRDKRRRRALTIGGRCCGLFSASHHRINTFSHERREEKKLGEGVPRCSTLELEPDKEALDKSRKSSCCCCCSYHYYYYYYSWIVPLLFSNNSLSLSFSPSLRCSLFVSVSSVTFLFTTRTFSNPSSPLRSS